jgi:hypothetical protein
MSDDAEENRRSLRRRRSASRRKSIARFAERQRIKKRWIALIDLIAWCAQSTTAASNDEEARARDVAYRRLAESILRGEFEQSGRSKVLYLDTLVTSDGASPRCRLTREQFEIAFAAASLPLTVLNCCWLPSDIARQWLEAHGYRRAPHFEPAPGREAAHRLTISLEEASARAGKAKFGADWIGKLTERERWLVKRYVEPQHDSASTFLPGTITYVGPGGPFVPVNDSTLAAEVERARDRLEQMNDQYNQVDELLEDWGFDLEVAQLDLAQFEHVFAAAFPQVDKRIALSVAVQDPLLTGPVLAKPETASRKATGDAYTHSGFAGRPSKGKHLIDDEFDRRVAAGTALRSLADEAKALFDWFKQQHPTLARPTTKTIKENIRARHREWKASRPEAGTN